MNQLVAVIFDGIMHNLAIPATKCNDQALKLYSRLASCSLDQFMLRSRINKIQIFKKEKMVAQLLDNLVQQVMAMHKKGVYHSDIKPENIVIDFNIFKDRILFRFIEFGVLVTEWQTIRSCAPKYFCTKNRTLEALKDRTYKFKSQEDRLRAELYSVHFVIMELMIISVTQEVKQIKDMVNNYEEKFNQVHQYLEQFYSKELINILRAMMKEDYSIETLCDEINSLKKGLLPQPGPIQKYAQLNKIQFESSLVTKNQQVCTMIAKYKISEKEIQVLQQNETNRMKQAKNQTASLPKRPSKYQSLVKQSMECAQGNQSRVLIQIDEFDMNMLKGSGNLTADGKSIIIEKIGQGAYGQVFKVFHLEDNQIYALKEHNGDQMTEAIESYKIELANNINLSAKTENNPQISKYFLTKVKHDSENLILYYPCGICSLERLITERFTRAIRWEDRIEVIYQIFHQLYSAVMELSNLDFYHSDIKSRNIIVDYDVYQDQLIFKIIDFGSAVNDFRNIFSWTPTYFCNSYVGRTKQSISQGTYNFTTKEQRVRAELYCVSKVIFEILCTSIVTGLEQLAKMLEYHGENIGRQKTLQKLARYYPAELVGFVKTLGEENYDIVEVKKQIENAVSEVNGILPKKD